MRILTIPSLLCGNKQAITTVANCKHSIWIGLLLVVSAGFAREYDAEYLIAEPWHLLIPLAASIAASVLFYLITYGIARRHCPTAPPFLRTYRTFLALFWMTAPLAWLYAIPVERWMDEHSAVESNLMLLRIVSVWRVLLMARIVTVLFGCSYFSAFACVMLIADITMFTALSIVPLPVLQLMGGIRLSNAAASLAIAASSIRQIGFLTMPIWIYCVIRLAFATTPEWKLLTLQNTTRPSRPTWLLAFVSVGIWATVLPATQQEQRIRYQAETLLQQGQLHQALQFLSKHDQQELPPLWDPPPRRDYRIYTPNIIDVMNALHAIDAADWVAKTYEHKFKISFYIGEQPSRASHRFWSYMSQTEANRLIDLLKKHPHGSEYATELLPIIERCYEVVIQGEIGPSYISANQLNELKELAGSE